MQFYTLEKAAEIRGFANTDRLRYKCKSIGCGYGGGMVDLDEFDKKFAKWIKSKKKRTISKDAQKKMQKSRPHNKKAIVKSVRRTTVGKTYSTIKEGLNAIEQFTVKNRKRIETKAVTQIELVTEYNEENDATISSNTVAHSIRRMKKYGVWDGHMNLTEAEEYICEGGLEEADKYPSIRHYCDEVGKKFGVGSETLRKDFGVMRRMGAFELYKIYSTKNG